MSVVLWLMLCQGIFGAFDTLYYHEYLARLPAGGAKTRPELWLHAARDVVYAVLFASLPFFEWRGLLAGVLAAMLAIEIVITMADFVVEVRVREPVGVLPGERVTHGCMAIIYGAILAHLIPQIADWWTAETAWASVRYEVPRALEIGFVLMSCGLIASGIRDAYAALGLPGGSFPWREEESG